MKGIDYVNSTCKMLQSSIVASMHAYLYMYIMNLQCS